MAVATCPFLSRLLVVLSAFVSPFFILFSALCIFFLLGPSSLHARTTSLHHHLVSVRCSRPVPPPSCGAAPWRSPAMPGGPAIQPALLYKFPLSPLSTLPSPLSSARPLSVVPLLRVLAAGRLRAKAVSRAPSSASGPLPCLLTCRPTWAASPDTPSGGLPRRPLPPAAPPSVP